MLLPACIYVLKVFKKMYIIAIFAEMFGQFT